MSTTRHPVRHPPRDALTHEQEWTLLCGRLGGKRNAFASEEEWSAAWAAHRDRLMGRLGSGRRPHAWWLIETDLPFPGLDQGSVLYEANLLSEAEKAELLGFWRQQFNRMFSAHFFVSAKGQCLSGWRAYRVHLRWMDLPASLRRQWIAERRRRGLAANA